MTLICTRCHYRPTRGTLAECPKCGADLEETSAAHAEEKGKRDKRKLASARAASHDKRLYGQHES